MLKEKTKIFRTLSDPNRLRILKMLQAKHLCVCEITGVLGLAASTVSKHLSILKNSGFIIEEKEGKWVNYMINPRPSDERISYFLTTLDFWIADEQTIVTDRQKALKADRNEICSR
jgi:ArsR family transcriptional regulator, arsenate/arsenite/antimonite-responsive transcriptional repressor